MNCPRLSGSAAAVAAASWCVLMIAGRLLAHPRDKLFFWPLTLPGATGTASSPQLCPPPPPPPHHHHHHPPPPPPLILIFALLLLLSSSRRAPTPPPFALFLHFSFSAFFPPLRPPTLSLICPAASISPLPSPPCPSLQRFASSSLTPPPSFSSASILLLFRSC